MLSSGWVAFCFGGLANEERRLFSRVHEEGDVYYVEIKNLRNQKAKLGKLVSV